MLRKYANDVSIGSPELPEKTIKIARVGTFLLSTDANDEVDVNCYDSPGYGDFVDNTSSIENIKKYVLQCHKSWKSLDAQSMTEADFLLADERIHCMFYFMGAHRMKAIDREFIAALAPLVPIVPVIGKADAMTLSERATYLDTVQRHLAHISERIDGNCVYDFDGDDLLFEAETTLDRSSPPPVAVASAITGGLRSASPGGHRRRPLAPAVTSLPLPIEKSRYSDLHEHLTGRTSTLSVDESLYDHSLSVNATTVTPPSATPHATAEACKHNWQLEPADTNLFLRQPNIFAVICDATAQRVYPWGTVPIENTHFSDFRRLQAMIFETGESEDYMSCIVISSSARIL